MLEWRDGTPSGKGVPSPSSCDKKCFHVGRINIVRAASGRPTAVTKVPPRVTDSSDLEVDIDRIGSDVFGGPES